jgi:DHA3 family macrolide efflux protein-like MFS transporter
MAFYFFGGCFMKRLSTLYILIITQGINLIGSRMSGIAIGIWLYQTKGSVTYLLLIPFFNEFPPIILGNFAGLLVDKWKRKHVMIIGDLGQGLGTLILLLVIATHNFHVWYIYLVVSIQGCFSLLEGIAMDASTTLLVPEKHRERVNAIKEMTFPLAGIIAPIFSGILYALVGMEGVLIADLATFIISVFVLLCIKIPNPLKAAAVNSNESNFVKNLTLGLKYLFNRKELLYLSLYITFTNFMLNGPLDLVIPYTIKITGNQLITSLMLGIMSFGAFTGACLLAVWGGTRPRIHTLIPGMILNGIMMVFFGLARMPLSLAVALFILMIPLPISNALFMSIMQIKTPAEIQGRVFAAISQLTNIVVPISFLLTGFLIDKIIEPSIKSSKWSLFAHMFGNKAGTGMGLLISIAGAAIALVSILLYLQPSIRKLEEKLPDYKVS